MQNTLPIPQTFTGAVWFVLAIFLSSLVGGGTILGILKLILTRKQPEAEIHESQARVAKTYAEADTLKLQANITAGDAVLRMVQQLVFTQSANEQLHRDNERLQNENDTYERQIQWAKGIFKMKGIQWEDHE